MLKSLPCTASKVNLRAAAICDYGPIESRCWHRQRVPTQQDRAHARASKKAIPVAGGDDDARSSQTAMARTIRAPKGACRENSTASLRGALGSHSGATAARQIPLSVRFSARPGRREHRLRGRRPGRPTKSHSSAPTQTSARRARRGSRAQQLLCGKRSCQQVGRDDATPLS